MEAYKKAALYLHGLNEEDASWMLQQLPEDKSSFLQTILDELQQLGIPKERTLLDDVLSSQQGIQAETAEREVSFLASIDAGDIVSAFESESDEVFALFLSIHEWPWKEQALSGSGLREQKLKYYTAANTDVQISEKAKRALIKSVFTVINSQTERSVSQGLRFQG